MVIENILGYQLHYHSKKAEIRQLDRFSSSNLIMASRQALEGCLLVRVRSFQSEAATTVGFLFKKSLFSDPRKFKH